MDDFLAAATENQELYEITLTNDGPVIFKLLPVQAYQGLSRLILEYPRTQPEIEDAIWKLCVVLDPYGDNLEYALAGIVTSVAQLILYLSFPKELADVTQGLNIARQEVESAVLLQIQAEICRVFPAYTPTALDLLEMPQIMRLMAQAEYLTKQPFQFETPQKAKTRPGAVGPTGPAGIDFEAENQELGREQRITDPHELFGIRRD